MNVCKWLVLPALAAGLVGGAATAAAANPYFSAVLRDNPALYWTFDEASGTALNYGHLPGGNLGIVGSARGVSTTTPGGADLGSAAQFDGTSSQWFYTEAAGGSRPLGGVMDSYVIEMWAKATAHTDGRYIMEVGTAGQTPNRPAVIYNFNTGALEMFGGGGQTGPTGPMALADGQWHHIVVGRHAGSGNHTFIIDGGAPQTLTGFDQPFHADNHSIILGAASNASARFGGSLDEYAVYDLTGASLAEFDAKMADIAAHRNISADSPVPSTMTAYTWAILKANPRFYWNFNEPSPQGNAVDLVRGQANDELIAYRGARRKLGASENLGLTAAFDGDNFFAANALGDGEMPGAWAVEMWIQAEGSLAGNRRDYLLHAGSNSPALIYDFGVGGDDKIELFSSGGRTAGNGPSIEDNEWHHIVATFYGNNGFGVADRVDFAVDGVVMPDVGRGGFTSGFDLNSTLRIGAALAGGQDGFRGKVDEVALYDLSGMTEAQVAARTAQLASHYYLLNEPAETPLRFVDRERISYTYGTQPSPNYPDISGRQLTDGVIGSTTTDLSDRDDWVGIQHVDPQMTFDLGATMSLDSIWIDYLAGGRAGVHAPESLDVRMSLDGIDFGDPITFTDFNNAGGTNWFWNRRLIAEMNGAYGRYVQLDFTRGGEWTFLGEVQFVVPEPGAGLLLLSALAWALLVRRRRGKE